MKNINKGTPSLFHQMGRPYTTLISKVIESIKNPDALAIWTFLQSKDNNWNVVASWMQSHFGIGKDRYRKAMRYLVDMGLVKYVKTQCDESGKLLGTRVIVNFQPEETDSADNRTVGKPDSRENRQSDNQQLPIKDSIPIKENNNIMAEPSSSDMDSAFEVFWKSGIRKLKKADAKKSFDKQVKLAKADPMDFAQMLNNDVKKRLGLNQFGFNKLHPTSYLNGQRWNDDYVDDRKDEATDKGGQSSWQQEWNQVFGGGNDIPDDYDGLTIEMESKQ